MTARNAVLYAWIEPRLGARLAWRNDRTKYWKLGVIAALVISFAVWRNPGAKSFSIFVLAAAFYAFLLCWSWAYSFARRTVCLRETTIEFRVAANPRLLSLDKIADFEVRQNSGQPYLHLKLKSNQVERIFLPPDVSVPLIERYFEARLRPRKASIDALQKPS